MTEGNREIEAARKRLAAAKSQVSIASKNMQSVKEMIAKMLDGAKVISNAAEKEEKRWEVIDIKMTTQMRAERRRGR